MERKSQSLQLKYIVVSVVRLENQKLARDLPIVSYKSYLSTLLVLSKESFINKQKITGKDCAGRQDGDT